MHWEFRQFWSSGNRECLFSMMPFFDLILAQMQKPWNGAASMIQDGSGKICLKSIHVMAAHLYLDDYSSQRGCTEERFRTTFSDDFGWFRLVSDGFG